MGSTQRDLAWFRWLLIAAVFTGSVFGQQDDARAARARRLALDWAGLTHYGSDDTEIPPPKAGENRVIFLGDRFGVTWPAPRRQPPVSG